MVLLKLNLRLGKNSNNGSKCAVPGPPRGPWQGPEQRSLIMMDKMDTWRGYKIDKKCIMLFKHFKNTRHCADL